jgi:hypothetical protein
MIPKVITAAFLLVMLALSPHQVWSQDASAGPRPGKYLIYSYGAPGTEKPGEPGKPGTTPSAAPLYLGYFILEKDGKYKVFLPGDKAAGEGTYEYNSEKKAITWKDGPYHKEWGGEFTVERGGKTHQIKLKKNTSASNSTDSKK